MKKTLIVLVLLVVGIISFIGCSNPYALDYDFSSDYSDPVLEPFEEISQPYREQYGEPDTIEHSGESFTYWHYDDIDGQSLQIRFYEGYSEWSVSVEFYYTFDQVTAPYIARYGQPEEITTYDSSGYHSVDYWWWSQGISVDFLNTTYDDHLGWVVDSTYTFSPIL